MNEPTRLLNTPESELERALLDAGRSYKAAGSTRTKTLLALGLSAVASSAAPPAAAASSFTKVGLSKVALTVLALGAVAVPMWRYFEHRASNPPVAHPPVVAAAPVASQAPPAVEAPAAETAKTLVPPSDSARVEAAEVAPSPPARSVAAPKSAAAPPLTAELAALDAARTSLSHSDPAGALVALDSYARNFPRGRLKIEAEVLRIGALAKSGQSEVARKRAETFLRLHPDSVLASRVRGYAGL